MDIRLPFRSPSRTTWQLTGSGVLVALVAAFLSAHGFGWGSFLVFTALCYALASRFSEWRRIGTSLFAFALVAGTMLAYPDFLSPLAAGAVAGAIATLAFAVGAPRADTRRITARVFVTALTFLAAFLLFDLTTLGVATRLLGFFAVCVLLAHDEIAGWNALRVGRGRLMSAAFGFFGVELAVFAGLLPLGTLRAAAFVALTLLFAREGLGEAFGGGLKRETVLQGLAVFFVLSVLLFASVPWRI